MAKPTPTSTDKSPEDVNKKMAKLRRKKVPQETIKMELFGDLMKISKKNPKDILPIKKYDVFSSALVAEPKEERLLLYKFFCSLVLTAHARRTNDVPRRKEIFEIKNRLYLSIANDFDSRRLVNFRFCTSKRFKVLKYCSSCKQKNEEEKNPPREWKFCNKCEVDRSYFNVLSMFHKFSQGGASMFLGRDLADLVKGLKNVKEASLETLEEKLTFGNYQFTPHNLITLDFKSAMVVAEKLLALDDAKKAAESTHQTRTPYSRNQAYPRNPAYSRSPTPAPAALTVNPLKPRPTIPLPPSKK